MARPRKSIDPEQVIKLAAIQCSYAEMAAVLDCNESTLTRRFAQAIKKGREQGKMSLKRKQYEMAMGSNVTMLIWLGKQHLEQRDKRDVSINEMSPEQFDKFLEGVADRLRGELKK